MTETAAPADRYTIKALTPETWDAYAAMLERHNGVFGGCWCTWFHTMHAEKTFSADANRQATAGRRGTGSCRAGRRR